MKVERSTASKPYVLYEGDQITVGVTHEIRVSGDKSWIRYEAITKVRPSESSEDAAQRAIGHVDAHVMEAVKTTVNTVNGVGR